MKVSIIIKCIKMDKILGLNNINAREGALKKKKRVGRGNASGHGTYSGKGKKGEKARTGSRNGLKVFGLRQLVMRTPKMRGFKSLSKKPAIFNVGDIAKKFKEGDTINLDILKQRGLVPKSTIAFKILGDGEINIKVNIEGGKVSSVARGKIEKVGGKIS